LAAGTHATNEATDKDTYAATDDEATYAAIDEATDPRRH
jgi:hypothetical protein